MKDRTINLTYLLLRVTAAFMFVQTGGTKLFGWFGGMPPNGSVAHYPTQAWFGGVLEVFGGALILFGLFTRPVAFLLSGEMAVAYWQFHYKSVAPWPAQNMGGLAVIYCFLFLFMAAYGGGEWSLDSLLFRRKKTA